MHDSTMTRMPARNLHAEDHQAGSEGAVLKPPLQGFATSAPIQPMTDGASSGANALTSPTAMTVPAVANRSDLPDQMKENFEAMGGFDLSDVRVHYGSQKPAKIGALAYAQGNQIYLGPGQQKHLGHEAWHVVQQKQGRVTATMQMQGLGVNDDARLEREAGAMSARAANKDADTKQARICKPAQCPPETVAQLFSITRNRSKRLNIDAVINSIDLESEERLEGHTIARHVKLRGRAQVGRAIGDADAPYGAEWDSLDQAHRALQEMLKLGKGAFTAFLYNSAPGDRFTLRRENPSLANLGTVFSAERVHLRNTGAFMLIEKIGDEGNQNNGNSNFVVRTIYPIVNAALMEQKQKSRSSSIRSKRDDLRDKKLSREYHRNTVGWKE